jgi:hypothetical protein
MFYGLAAGLDRHVPRLPRSGPQGRLYRPRLLGPAQAHAVRRLSQALGQRPPPDRLFPAPPARAPSVSPSTASIRPWRSSGDHILLAGMSAKAAAPRGCCRTCGSARPSPPARADPPPDRLSAKAQLGGRQAARGLDVRPRDPARGRAHQLPRGRDPPQQRRGRRAARRRAVHLPGGVASLLSGHDRADREPADAATAASSGRPTLRGPSGRSTKCRPGRRSGTCSTRS